MTMKRLLFLVPLAVFLLLAGYFAVGLTRDPSVLPSVLIDQPVPSLALPPIKGESRGFSTADLEGQVTLVNVFGSWCVACRVEHPFLMELKRAGIVPVFGIDWREKNRDDGPAWLARFGNPYTRIGDDPNSKAAIAFGVTGAPETFVVDHRGIIRYKHIGPLTRDVWRETVGPIMKKLRRDRAEGKNTTQTKGPS